MSWLRDRLREKSSKIAIAAAFTATGGLMAIKTSWQDPWVFISLIPIWVQSTIHFCDPDVAAAVYPQPKTINTDVNQ